MEYKDASEALQGLYEDPDIQGEVLGSASNAAQVARESRTAPLPYVPLNAFNGRHQANRDTAILANAAGGIAKFREMHKFSYCIPFWLN